MAIDHRDTSIHEDIFYFTLLYFSKCCLVFSNAAEILSTNFEYKNTVFYFRPYRYTITRTIIYHCLGVGFESPKTRPASTSLIRPKRIYRHENVLYILRIMKTSKIFNIHIDYIVYERLILFGSYVHNTGINFILCN